MARQRWYRKTFSPRPLDWRNLVLAAAFFATALTLLLSGAVPYPLTHFLPPPSTLSSYGIANEVPAVPPTVIPLDQLLPPSTAVSELVPPPDPGTPDACSSPLALAPEVVVNKEEEEAEAAAEESSGFPEVVRQTPLGSLSHPDQELAYAKKEIQRAPPLASDDPDLYAPLFRNVSVFKRSYELMEKILKVYIYRDGTRPIFHTPPIKGIYASEGWFMKIMERNRQFVVKHPNRAHLFYLPYSSHQLELALYDPNTHNMQQLSLFLKNYVNTLAAKYPFWNRTHGSDHFLVACHDWGPYTTKEHDELLRNTIKALCNADVSEGVFNRGRDVSLPETAIKIPRRPLRDLGGYPVSQRTILAFYAGHMHGRVRPILFKYWSGKDNNMKIYGPLPYTVSKKMSYAQHMKSSKFCICPMGYEVNSPRIVEAIYYECVPVIIADNFVLPFDEVLDWSRFAVIVEEKDIPNLKDILLRVSHAQYVSMHTSVQKLQKHFLWHAKPVKYDLFNMILHSIWFSRLNQIQLQQ